MDRKILVFLILGTVSLFADMTYEGARSVLGPYVELLGGSALIAGTLAIGDFLGYSLRLASGTIVGWLRSSKILWLLTIVGYVINLFSVPALAFINSWQGVLTLVILERSGKGLRTPARDVVLAEVSEGIGMGKGFGIHELMDQLGAILGPLIVSFAIATKGYKYSFLILIIPASIAISLIITSFLLYPNVKSVERKTEGKRGILNLKFILILTGISLLSIGFLHWSIISFYIKDLRLIPDYFIPILYMIAMSVDAAIAVPAGMLYDRYGFEVLILGPIAASFIPLVLTIKGLFWIALASGLWGFVMGLYETVMKAAVAEAVEPSTRAYAFGLYNFVFGVSWMTGSLIAGALYTKTLYPIKILMPSMALCSLIPLILAIKTLSDRNK